MNAFLKNTILFASLCTFISCNSGVEESENNPQAQPAENYVFKSITYSLENNESISTYEFSKVLYTYKNGTGIVQSYPVDYITGNVSNSFRFYDTDLSLLGNLEDSIYINIPVSIDKDNRIVLSDDRYLYTMGTTNYLPAMKSQSIIDVEPHQAITIECRYQMIKYTLNYTAIFIENASNKELNITGKWEGNFLQGIFPNIEGSN
ncbi:MAG: hypothetical protein LBG77_00345 [Dysgonamonadaceae bacterium]|jgi:hypothetical protein|nr:hypothetical protein [Dysgonamonadaceae bacterium]